jgi:hypothetical protein
VDVEMTPSATFDYVKDIPPFRILDLGQLA